MLAPRGKLDEDGFDADDFAHVLCAPDAARRTRMTEGVERRL